MQEPAQSRTPTRTINARKKGKVINNVTDLKTFLAKKKLERAQKLSDNHPSEEQPSRGPQNTFSRANQITHSGENSGKKLSLQKGINTITAKVTENSAWNYDWWIFT